MAVPACSAAPQKSSPRAGSGGGGGDGSGCGGGAEAGNNPVGLVIKNFYGIGGPRTIRWGLLKADVEPPQQPASRFLVPASACCALLVVCWTLRSDDVWSTASCNLVSSVGRTWLARLPVEA